MSKPRNGFKKLLANVKMNGLSMDANGEFTIINSSTNRKRMEAAGSFTGSSPNSKLWIPRNIYITEKDLIEIWNKQDQLCYWFKIPLDFNLLFSNYPGYFPKHPLAPSVDRIDDAKDYTKDNIVICCRFANFGRNVYPFKEFHDVVSLLKGEEKANSLMEFINA
jgi:hypothetical protein